MKFDKKKHSFRCSRCELLQPKKAHCIMWPSINKYFDDDESGVCAQCYSALFGKMASGLISVILGAGK